MLSPLPQLHDQGFQAHAQRRQRVVGAQLLDQHHLSQRRNVLLQFAGALRAAQQHVDDDGFLAPGNDAERTFDR